jgi:hypothetical protein
MNMRDYQNELDKLQTELERKAITPGMELFIRQVQAFASDLWARRGLTIHLLEVVVAELPDYSIDNPQPLNEHETLEIQSVVGPVIIRLRAPSLKATQGL